MLKRQHRAAAVLPTQARSELFNNGPFQLRPAMTAEKRGMNGGHGDLRRPKAIAVIGGDHQGLLNGGPRALRLKNQRESFFKGRRSLVLLDLAPQRQRAAMPYDASNFQCGKSGRPYSHYPHAPFQETPVNTGGLGSATGAEKGPEHR